MKKRIVGLAMSAAMAAGLLAGCGSSASSGSKAASSSNSESSAKAESSSKGESTVSSTEETAENIAASRKAEKDRTKLTVGFDASYPPYGYMDDDGKYTGFDLELAQKVCDMEGWKLVKKPVKWSSKDLELNAGNIDCIWNGFTINGREDKYTWSKPYVNNTQVVVVEKNSGISKLSDLKGKTVGVQAASAALSVLQGDQKDLAKTFKELRQFDDYNVAFTSLEAKSLDALAIDVGVANYQIKSRGPKKYVILDQNLNSEQYGIGYKKGNTSLRDVVDADLEKLAKKGTVKKLAKKYGIEDMVIIGQKTDSTSSK